ncbi:MAG: exodeoxyribonuclease V subunit gamma [Ruminococcus sp.]|nr:exodeoxyribonuclease V subunit gamma [Ruminococcus sp.]
MIEFIIGSSGTGKTTVMFERIKKFSEHGKKQCIIVPEQYSNDFDKKLYFHIGAKNFNELLSVSFSSLARQIFQIYGDPARNGEYADEMSRMILIYQAISSAKSRPESLSFFARRSSQQGFAEEIMKLINDMKHSGITPQQLTEKAELLDNKLRDKTNDIASIYYEYERFMKQYGFKDNLENIREAAKIANLNEYFKGKCVCLDEFESFNPDQIDMLKVIFSSATDVVISLRTDDVNAAELTLFETVNSTYRQLTEICRELNREYRLVRCTKTYRFSSPDLQYLSERAMRNLPDEPDKSPTAHNIMIFEARDMYSEAEYVCAEIKRLIHFNPSLKYRDIAIISNSIEEYSEVLKAAFERYDIPYFLSIEKSVNHSAIMVFFISLLDLLTSATFRNEHIFRLLKCGMLGESLNDISILENYCYKWGIDGDIWCEPFAADDDYIDLIESLRSRTILPLMTLKQKISENISAKESCRLIYNYLIECNVEYFLGSLMNELIKKDHDYEAAELKRLWGSLMSILDSVAGTLSENIIPFNEIASIMRSVIGKIKYSLPPQTLDAVTAVSARTARLDSPKIIFAIGSSDGDFPNQVSLHGLFSDGDKQQLFIQGIEISRTLSELVASERLIVYKALSTASDRLYLTYPCSNLKGQLKYPAPIVDQIQKMFKENLLITEDSLTPDFYAVTMHAAYYHYMQNRALNNTETASIEKLLRSDDFYNKRIESALSKSSKSSNYHIETKVMEKLKNFTPLYLTPTSVEDYSKCHFMHFCKSCLHLKKTEKIDLDIRIAGELAHNCFFAILNSHKKDDFITLTYQQLFKEINTEALKYRNEKMAGNFAKTPRFELLFNKLIEQLIVVFMHMQQSLMISDFVPSAFELDLSKSHSVWLKFGENKKLSFGGIVDRVDTCKINGSDYIRVVDYKSSIRKIDEYTLADGLNLQMLIYLFAAVDKGALYDGFIPAGILYTPVRMDDLDSDDIKILSYNQSAIDSKLKTTGLLIDNKKVLEAMEHGVSGRFIPVNIKKDGTCGAYSSVISEDLMDDLKKFVYQHLIDMAESMYNGNIEAVPLLSKKKLPCKYCEFADICGNGDGTVFHESDEKKLEETKRFLRKSKKDKDKKGGK